ncbi:glycoside hydrolase family 3 protein [Legionella longbeachae]|uniref:beta-N-acetylhexosaminidase n=1 Tax=Legionella longbeachae serogroup 1 (strain NSW150) TaxID=661367 RepID=D3HKB8_LEGLN|nr:glycoside hydrolase family 3 N-terminal domain-containing protein [Legionella longbeachae]VEE03398.1 glycosyl hydrolase [Legionella oakridgensis]HBD7397674.1 glycoside hydrolase family 3 protein [Legionella pneumophila]ARB93708.1 glycosyl hydrolase [Legionella longbeachae]ARM33152.1 glycoside hydrolase family 3 protein [Legionella longbeachae]EEZ93999.1 glycosyl hydrolase family 3 protein [Legionella longbeachae D-4968]
MITLRNKIGQMLIMGFDGCTLHDQSPMAEWLSSDGLGGVLLFDQDESTKLYGKNLKNLTQIQQLTHSLNYYSSGMSNKNNGLPLLIAIDYEGGAVDRLSRIEEALPTISAYDMAHMSPEALHAELIQMALTLKSLGFNLNFAPVVDLNLQEEQGIIGALHRSFSAIPEQVIRFAKQFVNVFSHRGIACCYKHFPGHGSALGDTHKGFVDVTNTFQKEELEPYYSLVRDTHQPTMIMTAHVVNKHLDSQGLPATLSYEILTGLLRQSMGYNGVVIADDLQMQAITDHYSLEDALCLTINAGADMIIFANQLAQITAPEIIEIIERLVLEQKIEYQRIEDAYRRIIRLKQQINCIELVD